MIKINGKSIGINKINSITIENNVVIVNGKRINVKEYSDDYIINIEVDGDVHGDIYTNGNVSVKGNCKNIDTNGSVEIGGDVQGDIDANGNINCYGDINGDIDTNGNVSLRRK